MRQTMRLTATLSLSAASVVLAGLCAAQPLRTAAAEPAVPVKAALQSTAPQAAATPAAAMPTTVAAATPEPASAAPAAPSVALPTPEASTTDGIAATVGDNSVSDYELDQRVALFFATSGFKPTADDMARARKQQLDSLIEEHIQLAEARKRKVTVSPVEVDKRLEQIAKGQGITVKQLTEALEKAGSSIDVLRAQQTVSIAWQKVIGQEFGDQVVVTPAQVDDALHRAAEGATRTHYRVMEIFMPVDSPDKDAGVKKQMEEVEAKIRGGASFRNVAQQFSRNPSAAAGGDIGWVYDGQLDPDLNKALSAMRTGELSHPVRAKGGWYLLGLQERQEPLGTTVKVEEPPPSGPPGTLKLARMLLPLMPNPTPEAVQNTLNAAEQIRVATSSCEALKKYSEDPRLKGSVFMMLGDVKVADTSEQMQKALAPTHSGDVAEPFKSDAGIEIIARCDPRPPPARTVFTLPKREDIENELFQEQISAMARRFMRDIKRDANVQHRDENVVMDAALVK